MPSEPETWQDFHFPKAGLEVAGPFGRQPNRQDRNGSYVRSAASGVNVRSYDPATGRDRGGSRSGHGKYVAGRLPPVRWVVQHIDTVETTLGPGVPVEQSASGRVVYLVAVSQGVVKFLTPGDAGYTATTNNTGVTPPLNFSGVMMSAANNQLLFFVDGINYAYFKPATSSVEAWTATGGGTMPRDAATNGGRLICTWRGRSVISGLLKDPQNIFMSAVGDPFNFNYLPVPTTVTQAVALNLTPLGLIGDVVTALVPYSDDVLIVGGDHTIYAIRGDPANGGNIDRISDITGIAFGEAWCKDPYGNVYFFGSQPSVWRMSANGKPERISGPIEPLLQGVDTGNTLIRLVWDHRHQEVHLYLTKAAAPAATVHYAWEYRSNSWWSDVFTNTDMNPLCCVAYDGNLPGDRAVLLGCWDGYVRFIDHTAATDDTVLISSSVLIGPIMTQQLDEMLLKDLQFVLAEASGAVTWEVLAGKTAEAAVAAAARVSGTAAAGRNPNRPIRVADHAIYIRISSTNRWAMEAIRTRFQGKGKVRRRTPN